MPTAPRLASARAGAWISRTVLVLISSVGMTTVGTSRTSVMLCITVLRPGPRSSARASSREMTVRSAPVSTMK